MACRINSFRVIPLSLQYACTCSFVFSVRRILNLTFNGSSTGGLPTLGWDFILSPFLFVPRQLQYIHEGQKSIYTSIVFPYTAFPCCKSLNQAYLTPVCLCISSFCLSHVLQGVLLPWGIYPFLHLPWY